MEHTGRLAIAVFFLPCLILSACADTTAPVFTGDLDLTEPWVESRPETVGGDAALVKDAINRAGDSPRLLSLLAVKDGRLVVEEYFRGNKRDSLNDVRSVTKSIVSALTGIALGRGFISSLDESIATYLQPAGFEVDSARREISIGDLLTMTSGFEWDESGGLGSYSEWITSGDHVEFLLSRPLINEPGSTFLYNSAAVHLLGVIVEAAVGMPLTQFAKENLFGPAGITEARWESLTSGHVNGGAGIDLRPRDLARFGQLFLQGGRSGKHQVLPDMWSTMATTPKFSWRVDYGPVQDYTYGYLWWVVTGDVEPAYYAWGFGGQFVYVVPDLQLVVVATTEWQGILADGGPAGFELAALDIIINHLVPAFRNP